MSAQLEVAEWQSGVIEAVEEACREKIDGFSPGSRRYLLSTADAQEHICARNGPSTLRIAEILGEPLELVRSRLRLLARNGLLIRKHGDTEGCAAKWWVPGLLARLKREEA